MTARRQPGVAARDKGWVVQLKAWRQPGVAARDKSWVVPRPGARARRPNRSAPWPLVDRIDRWFRRTPAQFGTVEGVGPGDVRSLGGAGCREGHEADAAWRHRDAGPSTRVRKSRSAALTSRTPECPPPSARPEGRAPWAWCPGGPYRRIRPTGGARFGSVSARYCFSCPYRASRSADSWDLTQRVVSSASTSCAPASMPSSAATAMSRGSALGASTPEVMSVST